MTGLFEISLVSIPIQILEGKIGRASEGRLDADLADNWSVIVDSMLSNSLLTGADREVRCDRLVAQHDQDERLMRIIRQSFIDQDVFAIARLVSGSDGGKHVALRVNGTHLVMQPVCRIFLAGLGLLDDPKALALSVSKPEIELTTTILRANHRMPIWSDGLSKREVTTENWATDRDRSNASPVVRPALFCATDFAIASRRKKAVRANDIPKRGTGMRVAPNSTRSELYRGTRTRRKS